MCSHSQRVLLVLALVCGCRQPPRETEFDDPAQASTRVRALVDSCAGVTRVLDRLARARITGRVLDGLVGDALDAAKCSDLRGAVTGQAAAHQLARARLDDARPESALADLTATNEPAIAYRRAELLDRLGRSGEALEALSGIKLDEQAVVLHRMLQVSHAVRSGDPEEATRVIESAPLPEQPRLAHRAVEDAPQNTLDVLARAGTLEVAVAAADRLEQLEGPAAVLPARERIAVLDASVADHWDALGRARIASGQVDTALSAWDRAIEIAPAQPAFRIAPIRALVIAEQPQRARERVAALAKQARDAKDVELIVTASSGAAAAGDAKLAVELARDARMRRTGDGRLAFLVAPRLAEAGEAKDAADAYAELLVCGAHGRAWHRHEVAGKLLALAGTSTDARTFVQAAIAARRSCETVEPADFATYLEGLSR